MPHLPRGARFVAMAATLFAAASYVAYTANWSDVAIASRQLSLATCTLVFGLFVLASLLACLRLWTIASDIGAPISGVAAIKALSVGSLAGALFFQLLGQTLARSVVLSNSGTPTAATLAMTGYEKVVALLVSVSLGAAGAWILFGQVSFDVQHGGAELLKAGGSRRDRSWRRIYRLATCCGHLVFAPMGRGVRKPFAHPRCEYRHTTVHDGGLYPRRKRVGARH